MKLAFFVIFALAAITINAQETTDPEIDIEFITQEARTLSLLDKTDLESKLKEYYTILEKLEIRYLEDFTNVPKDDEERMMGVWAEHFKPNYQKASDKFIIIKAVCEQLFESCESTGFRWMYLYDRRSDNFHKRYVQLVTEMAEQEYENAKKTRTDL